MLQNAAGFAQTIDYVNAEDFAIRGLEYQLKWRPWAGAQLILNQAWTNIDSQNTGAALAAPKLATSVMWTQKLLQGIDLSLIHHERGRMTLQGSSVIFPMRRTDVRVAMPLRFGSQKGEVALVVQNLGAPYQDFNASFQFQRSAWISLRVEN